MIITFYLLPLQQKHIEMIQETAEKTNQDKKLFVIPRRGYT